MATRKLEKNDKLSWFAGAPDLLALLFFCALFLACSKLLVGWQLQNWGLLSVLK